MTDGFCAIGVWHPIQGVNIGTLIRSAHLLGANFVFTVGKRYVEQESAVKLDRHIPVLHFKDARDWKSSMPVNSELVTVELAENAESIFRFAHPQRAVYLLGAEDTGIPDYILRGTSVVKIPQARESVPLNVATAGSIVLYDRMMKMEGQ